MKNDWPEKDWQLNKIESQRRKRLLKCNYHNSCTNYRHKEVL